MNSPERHFTRYMDHDWGDGSFGHGDRVLYTCDEDGPDGPLYDEHFQPIIAVEEESMLCDGPLKHRCFDSFCREVGCVESPPEEPIPPPTGPVTLSYRRGEGLQSSWAIIKKGGVIFAEEPISHDLCDALLQMDNLIQSAIVILQHEIVRSGWTILPESGLGAVLYNLLNVTGGKPW
jgi:hypothetical protein